MKYIIFFLRHFYEIVFLLLAVAGLVGVCLGNSYHVLTTAACILCWHTIRAERKQNNNQ